MTKEPCTNIQQLRYYLEALQRERDEWEAQKIECPECGASGDCPRCTHGRNEVYRCPSCGDSRICYACEGVGHIDADMASQIFEKYKHRESQDEKDLAEIRVKHNQKVGELEERIKELEGRVKRAAEILWEFLGETDVLVSLVHCKRHAHEWLEEAAKEE